jgi:hypothetical protein
MRRDSFTIRPVADNTLPALPSPAASIPEITDGDRVRVEVSPYDLNRGRIV